MPLIDNKPRKENVTVFRNNNNDYSIVEILSSLDSNNKDEDEGRFCDAYCIRVEPKACNKVVRTLASTLPLEDCLSHLKRVRRRSLSSLSPPSLISASIQKSTTPREAGGEILELNRKSIDEEEKRISIEPIIRPKKRLKSQNFVLEILIGTRRSCLGTSSSASASASVAAVTVAVAKNDVPHENHSIVREFGPLYSVIVPKYEPHSEQEWKDYNDVWPTYYYPLKFDDYKQKQREVLEPELDEMNYYMERSMAEKSVLIVDPKKHDDSKKGVNECTLNPTTSGGIVSISKEERTMQIQQQSHERQLLLDNNPLATPILLAIQGVSRREREREVIASIKNQSNSRCSQQLDRKRQYLCTGYDVYCFYEPSIFGKFGYSKRMKRKSAFIRSLYFTS